MLLHVSLNQFQRGDIKYDLKEQTLTLQKPYLINQNRCGYCGDTCGQSATIKKMSGSGKNANASMGPFSKCPYYYKFSLKSAENISKRNPCTNRPVNCAICSTTFWSWNIILKCTN